MGDNFIERFACSRIISQRASLESDKTNLLLNINDLNVKITNIEREKATVIETAKAGEQAQLWKISQLEKERAALQTKYTDLLTQFNSSLPSEIEGYSPNFKKLSAGTQARLVAYENKYTKAFITFPGRPLDKGTKMLEMDVKGWLGVGSNDTKMGGWLTSNNCRVSDVIRDYPNKSFDECCEICSVRVEARLANPYEYDSQRWGRSEYWDYGPETFYAYAQEKRGSDCDAWASLKYTLKMMAGVPHEMMRFIVGTTFGDEGHATNGFFSPTLGYFCHQNSTSRGNDNDDIRQFPKMGDSSQQINIKIPWWSSTPKFSYYQMITDAQAKEVNACKKLKSKDVKQMRKVKVYTLTGERLI